MGFLYTGLYLEGSADITINWGQLIFFLNWPNTVLSVHFAYFVLLKIFYPIGRRCNYTFWVTTSPTVSIYGTTVKMLQNTVYCGLILQKVLLMIKMIIKQSPKNTTHVVLSLCNYFPLTIHCNERVVYLCMQYRSLPLKNFCEGVTNQWTHVTMHDVINAMHVTWAVSHIPLVRNYLKHYSWEVVKIFAVYIFWNVHCNRPDSMVNTICDF